MIVFLYDITYNACQTNSYKLSSMGARRYNDKIWSCGYELSKEQIEDLKKAGIGVENPIDRLDKNFKDRVELITNSPFWDYKMISEKEEYDLRKEGDVIFISDRDGYGFSMIQKTAKGYLDVYISSYKSQFKENIKDYLYKNPIQKVVLHHDFWDRPAAYEPTKVTDSNPNIINEKPLDYPKPFVSETIKIIESKGGTATATLMTIMPPVGTEVRIELEDLTKTAKFWEGATYKNKEELKRWGARWDADRKAWYFLKVPSESRQKEIVDMGIALRVKGE